MRCAAVLSIGVALIAGCAGGARMDERRSAFLGSSAEPSAVIAAELAFAREAHDKGTWTAFRHYAADDAVWPGPNWESVQTALKGVADPAQPIAWEPDRVWASCDGSYAFSTGPATHPSGRKSRFTTIWQMQDDGSYRWVLDQGFDLETDYDAPEMIAALIAECPAGPRPQHQDARRGLHWQSGQSDDGTLAWSTELKPDCSRTLVVRARRGEEMLEVFRRTSPPPAPPPGSGPQPVCA